MSSENRGAEGNGSSTERQLVDGYVSDGFVDGRRLRCLSIVDDFTKKCLAIEVDTSLPGKRVISVPERLAESRGLPKSVTVDSRLEFISKVLDELAYRRQLQRRFIETGRLQQNAGAGLSTLARAVP